MASIHMPCERGLRPGSATMTSRGTGEFCFASSSPPHARRRPPSSEAAHMTSSPAWPLPRCYAVALTTSTARLLLLRCAASCSRYCPGRQGPVVLQTPRTVRPGLYAFARCAGSGADEFPLVRGDRDPDTSCAAATTSPSWMRGPNRGHVNSDAQPDPTGWRAAGGVRGRGPRVCDVNLQAPFPFRYSRSRSPPPVSCRRPLPRLPLHQGSGRRVNECGSRRAGRRLLWGALYDRRRPVPRTIFRWPRPRGTMPCLSTPATPRRAPGRSSVTLRLGASHQAGRAELPGGAGLGQ